MVKCLIRIRTKVNVHLRMINHCYRDVKIRVLNLGPRLLGRALGALPLFPALTGGVPATMEGNGETAMSGKALETISSGRETGIAGEPQPGWVPEPMDSGKDTDVSGATLPEWVLATYKETRESGEAQPGWAPMDRSMKTEGEAVQEWALATEDSSSEARGSGERPPGWGPETTETNKEENITDAALPAWTPITDSSSEMRGESMPGWAQETTDISNEMEESWDLLTSATTVSSNGTAASWEFRKQQEEPVRYLQGLESLRDSAHSTPVRSSENIHALSPRFSRETVFSDDAYTPCASILPTPVCEPNQEPVFGQQVNGTPYTTQDEESDVAVHSNPDTEALPPALPGPEVSGHSESEPEQGNKFLQSVLRLLAVTFCLLLALLLLLVILAESDLELAFLRDIRLTPEFQQFHYQYFCPLRRWVSCKLHPLIRLIDS